MSEQLPTPDSWLMGDIEVTEGDTSTTLYRKSVLLCFRTLEDFRSAQRFLDPILGRSSLTLSGAEVSDGRHPDKDEPWTPAIYASFLRDVAESERADGLSTYQIVRLELCAGILEQMEGLLRDALSNGEWSDRVRSLLNKTGEQS